MKASLINNSLLKSATYLFNGYLVDCGDADKIFDALGGETLKGIFLTHCHQDHVYGIEKVLQRYPTAKVYCSQKTYEGLKDPMLNLSYIIPEHTFRFERDENIIILQEGIHQIDNIAVEVLSSVGHSDDCITYIIENNIFTGDAHIPFAKVFTKWPTSNKEQALLTEKKLLDIIQNRKLNVYPGHWQ